MLPVTQPEESAPEIADADVRRGQVGAENGDDGQGRGDGNEGAHTHNTLGDVTVSPENRSEKAMLFQDKDSAAVEPPRCSFQVQMMEYQRMSSNLENLRMR